MTRSAKRRRGEARRIVAAHRAEDGAADDAVGAETVQERRPKPVLRELGIDVHRVEVARQAIDRALLRGTSAQSPWQACGRAAR